MPVYQWVGKNRSNEVVKGEIELAGEDAVKNHLSKLRITPTKIKKKPKDLFANVAFLQPPVTEKDIIIFSRHFSTMIDFVKISVTRPPRQLATFSQFLYSPVAPQQCSRPHRFPERNGEPLTALVHTGSFNNRFWRQQGFIPWFCDDSLPLFQGMELYHFVPIPQKKNTFTV